MSVLFSIRCRNGMNHLKDRVPHMADGLCQFAHQYNNKVLICKVSLAFDSLTFNFWWSVLFEYFNLCFADLINVLTIVAVLHTHPLEITRNHSYVYK